MSSSNDEIRKFMEQRRRGASTGNREMRFDPVTQKFVIVERGASEELPIVLAEDLQAFARGRSLP